MGSRLRFGSVDGLESISMREPRTWQYDAGARDTLRGRSYGGMYGLRRSRSVDGLYASRGSVMPL
jgi:hypothetical protein